MFSSDSVFFFFFLVLFFFLLLSVLSFFISSFSFKAPFFFTRFVTVSILFCLLLSNPPLSLSYLGSFTYPLISPSFSLPPPPPSLQPARCTYGGSPVVFFSGWWWRVDRGGWVGAWTGWGLAVSRGEKRASKTKRGCLQARQAGNASLPGLSPSHCSLAILPAHTRLNLTAPLRHGSPLVICPSFPSLCLSLHYARFLSFPFDHALIYSLLLRFVAGLICFILLYHEFYVTRAFFRTPAPFQPRRTSQPADRNGPIAETSGVKS